MFKNMFTLALNMTRALAYTFGYELRVELTDHEIKLNFADPNNEENCWDETHYVSGNLFIQGYANPIKPEVSDDFSDYELIESERYKSYMRNSLIDDIMKASKKSGITIGQAVLALGSLQIATIIMMVIL